MGYTILVYLHTDHLGSISVATNAAGGVVSQQRYDPWGKVIYTNGQTPTKLNYTGQRKDDTALLYYRARYYDPALGRFISPDSIVPASAGGGVAQNSRLTVDFHETILATSVSAENSGMLTEGFWFQLNSRDQQTTKPWGPGDPQTLNRYSYVTNNPLKYSDPTGHGGKVVNNSDVPILVAGTKDGKERIEILPPGKSTSDLTPPMDDTDFWRPMDEDHNVWYKLEDNATVTVRNNNRAYEPTGVIGEVTNCSGIFGSGCEYYRVCVYAGPNCSSADAGHDKGGDRLPGVIYPDSPLLAAKMNTKEWQDAQLALTDKRRAWERNHARAPVRR